MTDAKMLRRSPIALAVLATLQAAAVHAAAPQGRLNRSSPASP